MQILGYHILDRKYNASDIKSAIKANGGSFSIATLEKDKLTFTISSNKKLIVTPINGGVPAYVMKVRHSLCHYLRTLLSYLVTYNWC